MKTTQLNQAISFPLPKEKKTSFGPPRPRKMIYGDTSFKIWFDAWRLSNHLFNKYLTIQPLGEGRFTPPKKIFRPPIPENS